MYEDVAEAVKAELSMAEKDEKPEADESEIPEKVVPSVKEVVEVEQEKAVTGDKMTNIIMEVAPVEDVTQEAETLTVVRRNK